MFFHHLLPRAADVFHGFQLHGGEAVFVFGLHFFVAHAVVVFGEQALCRFAVEVLQVGFGGVGAAVGVGVFVQPRYREFGNDGGFRHDDFVVCRAVFLADAVHFGFEGNQHVADFALDEAGGRAASAGIEDGDVREEVFEESVLFGFGFEGVLRVAECAKVGVAPVAAGFRVGEDDADAFFSQIAPVFDVLRVALAHEEGGGGVIRRAVMGKAFAPVFRQQLALAGKDFDVGNLVEGDDVRFQSLQNGGRLFGRAGVRLFDLRRVGVFFFVERVVAGEEFARDVVGGVQ